jgi:hypothetical protein
MTRVGFKPTIPVFERAKTVHALDRAATVIGRKSYSPSGIFKGDPVNKTLESGDSISASYWLRDQRRTWCCTQRCPSLLQLRHKKTRWTLRNCQLRTLGTEKEAQSIWCIREVFRIASFRIRRWNNQFLWNGLVGYIRWIFPFRFSSL